MHPNVEGYGVVSEGEVYHPSAFLDPSEKFKFAGDPEKQADYQESLTSTVPVVEITDEQSNADPATSTVKVDEGLTGDTEATVIETKKPEVDVTSEGEPNVVTEGPIGVPAAEGDVKPEDEVKFS